MQFAAPADGVGPEMRRLEPDGSLFEDEVLSIELAPAGDLFDDNGASSVSRGFAATGSSSRDTSCSGRSVGRAQAACKVESIGNAFYGRLASDLSQVARPPPGVEHLGPMLFQGVASCPGAVETRATVMLQRLPYHLTEWDVCRELDRLGFATKYDAVTVGGVGGGLCSTGRSGCRTGSGS